MGIDEFRSLLKRVKIRRWLGLGLFCLGLFVLWPSISIFLMIWPTVGLLKLIGWIMLALFLSFLSVLVS